MHAPGNSLDLGFLYRRAVHAIRGDPNARKCVEPDAISRPMRINPEARLRAFKLSFLPLAGVAVLAIVPVGRLSG